MWHYFCPCPLVTITVVTEGQVPRYNDFSLQWLGSPLPMGRGALRRVPVPPHRAMSTGSGILFPIPPWGHPLGMFHGYPAFRTRWRGYVLCMSWEHHGVITGITLNGVSLEESCSISANAVTTAILFQVIGGRWIDRLIDEP